VWPPCLSEGILSVHRGGQDWEHSEQLEFYYLVFFEMLKIQVICNAWYF
jgi:hypothetical protein